MTTTQWIELAAIVAFIMANGFFALSEFSIIASRSSKLREKVQLERPGARAAEKLHRSPDRFLASIQVGITLFGTLAGVFGGATFVADLGSLLTQIPVPAIAGAATPIAVVVVTLMITISTVVVGELVPKYLALSYPERYARLVAPPITVFIRMTSLFSRLLSWLANKIVALLGVRSDPSRTAVSEDEINLMIFEGRQKGVFDETEEKLIKSVFDFADSTVRRAMTPRTDVVAIEINSKPADVIETVIDHGYSRYPVFENTIDNVVGVLYAKDLIFQRLDPTRIKLKELVRKATFVPDSLPLSKLLSDFQDKRNRMAIVLDEYGGTAGIVALEDILEELVGDIREEGEQGSQALVKHSETVAFADGDVWPGLVNELLQCRLPEDNVDTLAGLVIDHLGRFPEKGQSTEIDGVRITVIERIENRLVRLRLEKLPNATNNSGKRHNGR